MDKRNKHTLFSLFGILVTIVVTGILTACTGGKTDRQLRQAESLIVHHPDSAMDILVNMDRTSMSEKQLSRQELLGVYIYVINGHPAPLDSAGFARLDRTFANALDEDGVKWSIIKSTEANRSGNPVARIEALKDAEFSAIQLKDTVDLGITYLFLSGVYTQGFNGTVTKHYADKAIDIFKRLNWPKKVREARMYIVGAYNVQRDYKTMLDSMIAMHPEVEANAHDSFKVYFYDTMARAYDSNGQSRKAIDIWHSIYDGKELTSNTLAHWAHAYCHLNKLDSAYMMIQQAKALPHNSSDSVLCLNVEYDILEKMGRRSELAGIDSLRNAIATEVMKDHQLEESSLALNLKYDSAARKAWVDAAEARNRTNVAIFIAILSITVCSAIYILLRRRNKILRLQHENDILKIQTMQDSLFKSDCLNKDMSARIAELFRTRFDPINGLAVTYFECKDTPQEQKRIHSNVKSVLSDFGTKQAIEELTHIVNGYKDNLMERFKADFPKISVAQYRLALYLFCGFSLPAISIFTDTDLRNIYVYKSRLKSMISKSESLCKEEYLQYFE